MFVVVAGYLLHVADVVLRVPQWYEPNAPAHLRSRQCLITPAATFFEYAQSLSVESSLIL